MKEASYISVNAANAVTASAADMNDIVDLSGMQGWAIYAGGLPASLPVLEIEYVYHFEGTPTYGAASVATPIPSAQPQSSVGRNFNNVLNAVNKLANSRLTDACISVAGRMAHASAKEYMSHHGAANRALRN